MRQTFVQFEKLVVLAVTVAFIVLCGCTTPIIIGRPNDQAHVPKVYLASGVIIDAAYSDPGKPVLKRVRMTHQGRIHKMALPVKGGVFGLKMYAHAENVVIDAVSSKKEKHFRTGELVLRPSIEFVARSGTIHYIGRLEIGTEESRRSFRTVLDLDLLKRVCVANPHLFDRFELKVSGPLAREDVVLPDCATLVEESGDKIM